MTGTARAAGGGAGVDDLRVAAHVFWQNLPVLVVGTLLCTATLVPGLLLSPGITPLAVVCAFVFGSPVWAATIAATDRVAAGDEVSVPEYLRGIRPAAVPAWRTAVVPAAVTTCALVGTAVYGATRSGALLACAVVTGGAAVILLLASTQVFSLRAATGLRGRRLWYLASVLALSRPMLTFGTAAFAVLGLLGSLNWSVSILFLVPGPLALLCSVASRAALRGTGRLGDDGAFDADPTHTNLDNLPMD